MVMAVAEGTTHPVFAYPSLILFVSARWCSCVSVFVKLGVTAFHVRIPRSVRHGKPTVETTPPTSRLPQRRWSLRRATSALLSQFEEN